jgi:hypothetical protein
MSTCVGEVRFEQDQRFIAALDQLREYLVHHRGIGIGMNLGANQAETISQPGTADYD